MVLRRTIEATHFQPCISETVVVVAQTDPYIENQIADLDNIRAVTGGATRTASVGAGLTALADDPPDLVLIHDGARPFVTGDVIDSVIHALEQAPAAVPALPIADALKSLDGTTIDREQLRRVQTPQGFHFDKIWTAFQSLDDDASFADDIEIAQMAGLKIAFTQGDPIECGFTLLGHSDADAGLHALTDAILGAIALGDIGDHFPPSDTKWKGASSDKFLEFAIEKVKQRGGQLQHVDITLICEKPKIKPHREAMRQRIAELCDLPLTRVSVKATTTEKLGFTGRGEGLAAQAAATVKLPA